MLCRGEVCHFYVEILSDMSNENAETNIHRRLNVYSPKYCEHSLCGAFKIH